MVQREVWRPEKQDYVLGLIMYCAMAVSDSVVEVEGSPLFFFAIYSPGVFIQFCCSAIYLIPHIAAVLP